MYKISDKYKEIIYSGDAKHQLKIWFGETELVDADIYCEKLSVTSRIIPNGSKSLLLNNFVSKEAELILHDIEMPDITKQIKISIGTLIDEETQEYEYVPIGIFNIQDNPTTDKNKTTFKLRDNSVKFDANYNAKELIETNGGKVTKRQILDDICKTFGVNNNVGEFLGQNDEIGIYDNTITGRTYIGYIAEQSGNIATIDREGNLTFIELNKGELNTESFDSNYFTLNKTAERPLTNFVLYGQCYQETNKVYNLINEEGFSTPKSTYNYYTNASSTFTPLSDGWGRHSFDGTQTSQYSNSFIFATYLDLFPSTTYTLFLEVRNSTNNLNIQLNDPNYGGIFKEYDTTSIKKLKDGIYKFKVTTKDVITGQALRVFAYGDNATTVGSFEFRMMILKGDKTNEDLVYQPYTRNETYPTNPCEIKTTKGIKNLFKANVRGTYSGNEFKTLEYGHILINGHTTQGTRVNLTDVPVLLENGKKYTMSLTKLGGSCTNYSPENNFALQLYIGEKYINFSSSDLEKHYTFEGDGTEVIPYFWMPYNNTTTDIHAVFSNYQIGVQIEEGEKAHDYVPYGNWLNIYQSTRNLFNVPYTESNKLTKTATKTDDYVITNYYAVLEAGKKYTFSCKTTGTFGSAGSTQTQCFLMLDKGFTTVWVMGNKDGYTFTPTVSGKYYLRYDVNVLGETHSFWDFQIEEGTEKTDFQIHKDTKYLYDLNEYDEDGNIIGEIEFCEIDEKDEIDLTTGIGIKHYGKYTFTGDERIVRVVTYQEHYRYGIYLKIENLNYPQYNNLLPTIVCNRFVTLRPDYTWGTANVNKRTGISMHTATDANGETPFFISYESAETETLDLFRQWLKDNPVTFYYKYAEPQVIQLNTTRIIAYEDVTKIKINSNSDNYGDITYYQQKENYEIPMELIEKYEIKDPYKISKVLYEDAIRKFETGDDEEDTLYLDTANPYISSQEQINSIYNIVVNYSIDSLNTGKIIGNPAIDPYDIVEFTDIDLETNESKTYKTLATNDLVYNGVFIQTFNTDIGIEEKKTNVTINSEATFKKWARTEIDNVNAEIVLQAGQISDTNANLEETNKNLQETNNNISENYYPKNQVEQLVLNSATGLTNTFSEAGGNNILKNTNFSANEVLEEGQIYEYWFGNVVRETNNSSVNGYSILLQNGNLNQDEIVANGPYTLSFYYKKTNPLANVYVLINGKQYNLDSSEVTLFQTGLKNEDGTYLIDPVNVSDNHFKVEFVTDIDNSCEIYDIMANYGTIKLAYSQNANETITDTVNISKGITITSSTSEVKFTANNNGIRTLPKDSDGREEDTITEFTDKGMKTKEAIIREEATIVGILRQRVGEQVWDSLI